MKKKKREMKNRAMTDLIIRLRPYALSPFSIWMGPPMSKTKAWFYFGSYRVSASDLLASRSLFLLPFVTNSALLILLWPFAAAGAVTGSSRALPFVGLGGIMPFFSLDFPHTTKYNPTATTAAPIRLITYTIVQKKKKKIVIFYINFA